MSHTAPPTTNRRRVELALGAVALILGLLALYIAVVALNHPKGRQASQSTSDSRPASSSASSSAARSTPAPVRTTAAPHTTAPGRTAVPAVNPNANRSAVVVLNNTSTDGLAATAAERLSKAGWRASDGGNFDGSIVSTAVYYDPSVANALSDAEALQAQFPAIQRVKERFSGLPQGPLILIVASDYS